MGADGFGVVLEPVLVEERVVVVDEREVEVEVEVDDGVVGVVEVVGVDVVVDVELVGAAVVVVVVDVEPVEVDPLASAGHDSFSDTTVPWIGRFKLEIGVPGVVSTLNVYVCPPRTVTVTVQASAAAIGAAAPNTVATAVPTTAIKSASFPLMGNSQPSPIRDQLGRTYSPAVRQPLGAGSY
ncbi:MAG TPA: hypothetical protein VN880_18245 [Solirubrobacteraceae bacterium]|nr:hypothetical protein [Solirubrobacteraceae bacterium]